MLQVNFGPNHPSTHGVLRLICDLDGEKVVGLEAVIGYLHTGIEKNMEHKTWWKAIITDLFCAARTAAVFRATVVVPTPPFAPEKSYESAGLRLRPRAGAGRQGLLPFDREANGSRQRRRVQRAFHDVILRTLTDGSHADFLVLETGEQDYRQSLGMSPQLAVCVKSLAVGQGEIEKNDIDSAVVDLLDPAREPVRAQDTGRNPRHFGE